MLASEALIYGTLGFRHLADFGAIDHVLFLLGVYAPFADAKSAAPLVLQLTAFTLGHSASLAGAVEFDARMPARFVEIMIAASIVVTSLAAAGTLVRRDSRASPAAGPGSAGGYLMAAGFGLIHGLGFSTFLRAALGTSDGIALPLIAFNVGLELAQLLIVAALFGATWLLAPLVARRRAGLVMSGMAGIGGVVILVDRLLST